MTLFIFLKVFRSKCIEILDRNKFQFYEVQELKVYLAHWQISIEIASHQLNSRLT